VLEAWIDARAAANEAFLVLGDFNRRMRTGEAFYTEIDDADPPNADLTLTTDGRTSACWNGEFPQFIDHIVVSRDAAPWISSSSFAQQLYEAADAGFKATLSDHCPVSVVITPGGSGDNPEGPTHPDEPAGTLLIKGNINSAGKKLYHLPNCPSYEEVQIDESKGERFFASEAEAATAGWQKAGNCP
jgi:Endonuclease/Exonuclease/phosphatase family